MASIPFMLYYDVVEVHGETYCLNTYTSFNNTAYAITTFVLWYLVPLVLITFMYSQITFVLRTSSPVPKPMVTTMVRLERKKHVVHRLFVMCYADGLGTASYVNAFHIMGNTLPANRACTFTNANVTKSTQRDISESTNSCSLRQRVRLGVRHRKTWMARRRAIKLLLLTVLTFAVCRLPHHVYQLWLHTVGKNTAVTTESLFLTSLIPLITNFIFYLNSALHPFLHAFLSDNLRRNIKALFMCAQRE